MALGISKILLIWKVEFYLMAKIGVTPHTPPRVPCPTD